jgi:hypothetical protein
MNSGMSLSKKLYLLFGAALSLTVLACLLS